MFTEASIFWALIRVSFANSPVPVTEAFSSDTESFGKCLKSDRLMSWNSTTAFTFLLIPDFTTVRIFPLNKKGIAKADAVNISRAIPAIFRAFFIVSFIRDCFAGQNENEFRIFDLKLQI